MATITKIRLKNFKKFSDFELIPNDHMNILVGDNETGKSTILEAISLVMNGSTKKQDSINLRAIFNAQSIKKFLEGDQKYDDLPTAEIDLFFRDLAGVLFNGDNNIDKEKNASGIRMIARPNPDYRQEIENIICSGNKAFPFEFYEIKFSTFADISYFMNRDKPKCILIDASKMSSTYSADEYIKSIFDKYTEKDKKIRTTLLNEFNKTHEEFAEKELLSLTNDRDKRFVIKSSTIDEFESHLTILEENVCVANKGTGQQVKIKTKMALEKSASKVDVVLLEEPENHLSDYNLKDLVRNIEESLDEQLFIATHNGYICSRLSLNNVLILGKDNCKPISLKDLSNDTSKYFVKAPTVGILDFSLSNKVVLVEGPSEYMLFDKLYKKVSTASPENDGVRVIATRGLSFKRYMEVADLLKIKVAVVTDNDGSYNGCLERYKRFVRDNIQLFVHKGNDENTFEKVLYKDNKSLIESIIKVNDVCSYMLSNKTESAYLLLDDSVDLTVPKYIQDAIEWIRK